ncbi:cytochrome P450 4V2 [Solenopsis invicta]|uniref:cytochrome P450 4V2 n=1 Tax=Solenopsis invicta TaxID=13686 RepID=UPI00193DE81E|nr:cytochrome P450 4V2 [Solenopsis invicta]
MVFTVVLITLACITVSYFVWNYCRPFFVRKEITLPGPRKLYTNFLRKNTDEFLNIINSLGFYYPSPFQIKLNYTPLVIIYEPDQVKDFLQNRDNLDKNLLYKFTEHIFGMGLLTAPESIWAHSRKAIARNFNPITLREFFNIFVERSLMLMNKLEKVGLNGKEFTSFMHLKTSALEIALDTMMGIKQADLKTINLYVESAEKIKNILRRRMYSTWIMNELSFYNFIFNNFYALGHEQKKVIKSLGSLTDMMTQHQLYGTHGEHTNKTKNHTNKTFFEMMLKTFSKKNFTEKLIRDNMITLLLTATDSIGVTLNFVVFMLANFSEIQEKVYKELTEIYGTTSVKSTPIKYEDLQHMNYLDRVIKETMRLFPTIPLVGRKLKEDMKIGEYIIPKNTNVTIAFMLMYRNEKYWPDPLKFDPDRFLPKRLKDNQLSYFAPFSDGPRNCIGMRYAMTSMKVILATLVRTFVLKVDEHIPINKIKLQTDITISPIKPFKIRIEKRNL